MITLKYLASFWHAHVKVLELLFCEMKDVLKTRRRSAAEIESVSFLIRWIGFPPEAQEMSVWPCLYSCVSRNELCFI
jgi:hypothetical protein